MKGLSVPNLNMAPTNGGGGGDAGLSPLSQAPNLNSLALQDPTIGKMVKSPPSFMVKRQVRGNSMKGSPLMQSPVNSSHNLRRMDSHVSIASFDPREIASNYHAELNTMNHRFSALTAKLATVFGGAVTGKGDETNRKIDFIVKRMKKEAARVNRLLESHNFDTKYPPLFKCYHYSCGLCFTTEEQYHRHILLSTGDYTHQYERDEIIPEQKEFVAYHIGELMKDLQQSNQDDYDLLIVEMERKQKNMKSRGIGSGIKEADDTLNYVKYLRQYTVPEGLEKPGALNDQSNSSKVSYDIEGERDAERRAMVAQFLEQGASNVAANQPAHRRGSRSDPNLAHSPNGGGGRRMSHRPSNASATSTSTPVNTIATLGNVTAPAKKTIYRREQIHLLQKYATIRQSTHFHMLLRNKKGLELFRQFYLKSYGLTGMINILDCYLAIQEWKKFPINHVNYYSKAIGIYEMYCSQDSLRYCDLIFTRLQRTNNHGKTSELADIMQAMDGDGSTSNGNTSNHNNIMGNKYPPNVQTNLNYMLQKCQQLKENEFITFPGFFHSFTAKLTKIQELFHSKPNSYIEWTLDKIIYPSIFQELEFQCFDLLYNMLFRRDVEYLLSYEYYTYLCHLEDDYILKISELYNDYRVYRYHVISDWSKSFSDYEAAMTKKSYEVVDLILNGEIELMYFLVERKTVREQVITDRHNEQSEYERLTLLIDESVHWAADNAADFIFDFYVNSLLKAMLDVPEYRKGMMQYAGLAQYKLKKKNDLLANYQTSKASSSYQESKEWFNKFFSNASTAQDKVIPRKNYKYVKEKRKKFGPNGELIEEEEEEEENPEDDPKSAAATMIQKQLRGLMARKQARKEFAKTFKKIYDPTYQAHYYYNETLKTTSWEPPKLFKKLYKNPKAKF
jgi:hypothetical protein